MDRFPVFAYYRYEPHGGWEDLKSTHATRDEADAAARAAVTDFEYGEVVSSLVSYARGRWFESISRHQVRR